MDKAEVYRQRAEQADQAAGRAQDPKAKQLLRNAAQRWRELASLAAAKEKNPENVWRAREVTFLKPSVRFGLLADILATRTDGRFTPKSGHESGFLQS